jgi:Na+/H+ antiporter
MTEQILYILALIIAITMVVMLADKLKVAYPIVLVIAGVIISFIPLFPKIHIDPDLIFIAFLPPLLYEAAWAISWKELWRWRRIISSFAFVVVFVTALSVALISNYFIPGFSIALGFLLGGIVSPPDAVSAGAILKFVKVPKRIASILEGESLLNDASSLIIFRFALIAMGTGQFIWYSAALNFGWMLLGGVGAGLVIGWLFIKAHKLLPTTGNIDTVLTLVTPYLMYIAAEEMHSSGVLAVVSGGLLLSNNRHSFLNSTSRLQGVNVWESLSFVLNGLVFLLIGLDLPEILEGLKSDGIGLGSAIGYGLLVTIVLVFTRIIAAYSAVIVTLIARNFINVADSRNPGITTPLILGWTGMRGVVSLAAALSIPITLNGAPFPHRSLILFITFIVILATLLIQGLTLPILLRKIRFPDFEDYISEEEAEKTIRTGLAEQSLKHLQISFDDSKELPPFLAGLAVKWTSKLDTDNESSITLESKDIYLSILDIQRQWLIEKNHTNNKINEDVIRKHLRLIDIEEEKIRSL